MRSRRAAEMNVLRSVGGPAGCEGAEADCDEGDEAAVCADADDCDDDGSTVLLAPLAVGETTLEDFGGLKKRLPGGLEEKKE